jgi:outer membrane protein TolC
MTPVLLLAWALALGESNPQPERGLALAPPVAARQDPATAREAPPAPASDRPPAPTAPPPGGSHGGGESSPAPVAEGFLAWAPFLDREALVRAVLERNPSLEAARLAFHAAREMEAEARALPDPMLAAGIAPLSIGAGEVPFGFELRASQRLPYPGERRLAADRARAEAEAMGHELEAMRRELAAMASMLFDDYYGVEREIEVSGHHRELLAEMQRTATARYAAGLVSQADPLEAEFEAARLAKREVELEAERRLLVARLNTLLHRPVRLPLPPAPPLLAPPGAVAPDADRLLERALAARPELAALEAEIQGLEAEVGLARVERRPELEAMVSYSSMWSDREHRFMVGAAIGLPVRGERLAAVERRALLRLEAARARRARLADQVQLEVEEGLLGLDEQRRVIELYTSRLLPAAADQVRAALAGFRAGTVEFVAVIEAEENQREAELGYHEALAIFHGRRAVLARAVGDLAGIEDPGRSAPATADSLPPATEERP